MKALDTWGRSLLASCHLQAFTSCGLSWCRDSLHLLCYCAGLLIQRKKVLQLGCTSSLFSLPLSPAETSTHTSSLYLFPSTHSATHSQQDGCLFNPKPLMESAYCLWSTYSRWVNISQLRPLFFFPPWPQPEKALAGVAKSLSRAWYWPCLWLYFSSSLLLCRASCSGVILLVRAPGWYYCMLCCYKYWVWFGHKHTFLVNSKTCTWSSLC